jgi:hypothetical protein
MILPNFPLPRQQEITNQNRTNIVRKISMPGRPHFLPQVKYIPN